jgi:hypothetical protein
MPQVEINSPLTGSEVEASFPILGWSDATTTTAAIDCSVTDGTGAIVYSGQVQPIPAGGNWSLTTDVAVSPGSVYAVTATLVVDGEDEDSATTDNITVCNSPGSPTDPAPISVESLTTAVDKSPVTFTASGLYSGNLNAANVCVQMLMFHGNGLSQATNVKWVPTNNNQNPGTWSVTFPAPVGTTDRCVIQALLLDTNGKVLGIASLKRTTN